MTETFEQMVSRIRQRLREQNREKIDDLIHELREYHYRPDHSGSWSFDMTHSEAVERVHKFIEQL
jgi:hypothetical protein